MESKEICVGVSEGNAIALCEFIHWLTFNQVKEITEATDDETYRYINALSNLRSQLQSAEEACSHD